METRKIDLAYSILINIKAKLARKKVNTEMYFVDCYYNCREQGFLIICCDPKKTSFAFSECRNSDFIVVYQEIDGTIRREGKINDEVYRNSVSFETEKEVVDYIVNKIILENQ